MMPSRSARAVHFTLAIIQHITKGMPTCSQEQIYERLAICEQCPLFNGRVCTHEDCGCNISSQGKFFNKLAWADQSCPIGKWGQATE